MVNRLLIAIVKTEKLHADYRNESVNCIQSVTDERWYCRV